MWMAYAIGSAIFAGVTAILAKLGVEKTDSNVATAIRTGVVLVFAWLMVFVVGSQGQLANIDAKTAFFLIVSGLCTGASWLCYFRALQLGRIDQVVPVDKSSIVLTVVLAFIVFGEPVSGFSVVGIILIALGTFLMIEKKQDEESQSNKPTKQSWLIFAIGAAVFASLTTILGKVGIEGVESNLGTAIRTIIVLVMAWVVVAVSGKAHEARSIPRKELIFICLSGVATGASWLCFFRALQEGPASVVVPIDKLSIVVSIAFAYFVFGEKLTKRSGIGLAAIVAGTLLMCVQ